MKFLISIILIAVVLSISSCASTFNAVVFPNQCQKCMVIDHWGEVLFENEGCGGSNTNLEEDAKVAAYDLSRNSDLCQLTVTCETWTQEKDEEE